LSLTPPEPGCLTSSRAASLQSSLSPASPGCLVQLVPDVVFNISLGHILLPPFRFLGLHRNKKPPSHAGRSFHQNKTQFSSTPQVYHGDGCSPAGPKPGWRIKLRIVVSELLRTPLLGTRVNRTRTTAAPAVCTTLLVICATIVGQAVVPRLGGKGHCTGT
jgi:hypothetical protein